MQLNMLYVNARKIDATADLPYIDAEKDADILIIREIDACIAENGQAHHTAKYELMTRSIEPQLVIRRAQPFKIILTLSRPYKEDVDGISFIFFVEDEPKPSYGQGTLIAVPLLKRVDQKLPGWTAVVDKIDDALLTVQITPAHDCVIAKWRMEVDTRVIEGGAYRYSWETAIYIIFNPWNKRDQSYMRSDEWRDETVLNDVGLIWRGTLDTLRPTIWKYAQFDEKILDCVLYLLGHVGKLTGNARSDPIQISRVLAAVVNNIDDDGVVMGNWSNSYKGGTAPTMWMDSADILQKYYKKKKPVKYGQCWVFAGVLTTVCRAIGLPSRVITNYSSAHDTHSSLTVDYFMDSNGSGIEDLNSDSIWTFHVWNEVWMRRPDLSSRTEEYDGWQVIDATPQEPSERMYRCGPASVEACKQGEVLRPYDTSFLFAEVNADKVYWRHDGKTQPLKLLGKDIQGVGKLICTKAPGKFEREDITDHYKHSEKSKEERVTMLKALKQAESVFSRYYINEDFSDIHFKFHLQDSVQIGDPFTVVLEMKNRSRTKDYSVNVTLRVESISYVGKVKDLVKKDEYKCMVKMESIHEVKLNVKYEEYCKKLTEQGAFVMSCMAAVQDTKFDYFTQTDFKVTKPNIKITLPDQVIQGQEIIADLEFDNPLPVPLKKGEFLIDAPGRRQLKIKVKGAVLDKQKVVAQFKFTPPDIGKQTIAAKFTSKELTDIDGFINFVVNQKVEENGA
ncbi:Transglutaminase family [Popillia japonica]|uniref:protein-glutamine gamma-glutamyltransferase n=1 Tax=Popillia japonica TaxID=7064 RepID=A0AAW1L9J6_POPJA